MEEMEFALALRLGRTQIFSTTYYFKTATYIPNQVSEGLQTNTTFFFRLFTVMARARVYKYHHRWWACMFVPWILIGFGCFLFASSNSAFAFHRQRLFGFLSLWIFVAHDRLAILRPVKVAVLREPYRSKHLPLLGAGWT